MSIIIKYVYKVGILDLQAFQIDPDFNTLKIFTLTLISKIMKVFTATTTTTSLYDIPLFYY